MKVIKYLSYFFFLFLTSFIACTSDVKTIDANLLYGHWEIRSAQRDGQPTETLASTFFDFNETGKMTTNFNLDGNEISRDFEISGMNIIQKGDPEVSYSIEIIEEGKLVMLTSLMNYQFTLNLEKIN
jgi:hypothetical protein